MKIITLAHQKGGVGKSTLALNLAYAFNGIKVGVVDTDLQGSLASLSLMADGINLIALPEKVAELRKLNYDILIIDTPPYLSSRLPEVFSISDLVLVPTKTGFFDMMAIKGTVGLLQQSITESPSLKAGVLFNMVRHNSSLIKEVRQLTTQLEIPVLKTHITDRVSYTRSILTGGIMQSSDKNAQKEIVALCEEIMEILNL